MRLFRTVSILTAALAGVACVVGDEPREVVETFDGVTATSSLAADSAHDLCAQGDCIITRLTDTATGDEIARAVWNADTAVGEIVQDGRTSAIVLEDHAGMTVDEANDVTYASLQIASSDGEMSHAQDTPYSITCEVVQNRNGSCLCVSISCSGCIPVEGGEYCVVSSTNVECYPINGYGGYCGATRNA